jgi:hypothetical protein
MADDKAKLKGQRAAVREHIDKYKKYGVQHDKDTALKTIKNCQNQIAKILSKHSHWPSSWEDNWRP